MKRPSATGSRDAAPVFAKKRDIAVIAAVLVLAAVLWLVFGTAKAPNEGAHLQAVVTVTYGNIKYIEYIELEKEQLVAIDAKLPVHLQVMDGGICFIESVCPDHDCERFGVLSAEGEWAACLPAGVSVQVVAG